ncbi:MAG: hypothetical protein LUC20_04140, partial [Oscillospiraceae bacterium]|nr:hypothetical protein [Oscillospiraceae bacterium]
MTIQIIQKLSIERGKTNGKHQETSQGRGGLYACGACGGNGNSRNSCGGGIVAYSGYVDAANKGVDESLVSDVSYALQLAAYADTSFASDTAYIVGLQYDDEPVLYGVGTDITENPDELVSALEASFGSNLSSALQLKYSGWSLGAVSGLVSYSGSSFAGNEEALLSDIQVFTNAYKEFLEENPDWTTNFTSEDDAYLAYLSSLGVDTSDSTAVANATALYLASCAANADVDEHIAWWCSGLSDDSMPSEYENMTLIASDLTVYMGEIVAWEEAI